MKVSGHTKSKSTQWMSLLAFIRLCAFILGKVVLLQKEVPQLSCISVNLLHISALEEKLRLNLDV